MTEFDLQKQGDTPYSQEDFRAVLDRLLAPDGCPWDRAQTHESLRKNLIEEAYEAVDAIDSGRTELIVEELGDVLLQVGLHSAIAERDGQFRYEDVVDRITRKLIFRHSHVFGHDDAGTADEVLKIWDKNKQIEKGHRTVSETLQAVPAGLPALMRAEKIQKRAAKVGFDWPNAEGAEAKVTEELEETREVLVSEGLPPYEKLSAEDHPEIYARLEDETGDLLFAAVNYSRLLGIDPEVALNRATAKFVRRFTAIEAAAKRQGGKLEEMTLEEMDALWDQCKKEERGE